MIITDEKNLRAKCEDVLPEEVNDIIDTLEKELVESERKGFPGLGLAAPQIGISKKIAIVRVDKYKIDLVNPRIEKSFDLRIFKNEGCLSFPGRVEKTKRYNEIHVLNDGEPKKFIATGLLAVVCAHEINHLEGILLPDIAIKEPPRKKKTRPNDQCFCGSGVKAKLCCLKKK